ncbi:hypothetical protein LTR85_006207 [Meristemomyces frigidus]|nr:hypothetical protein LTR85_006207 [Meristemomyces frigidus]
MAHSWSKQTSTWTKSTYCKMIHSRRDPDDEDFEGFTGNAGASATHWYRDTVIVLVKKEHHLEFLLQPFKQPTSSYSSSGKADILPLLEAWLLRWRTNPTWVVPKSELENLCHFIVSRNREAVLKRQTQSWTSIPFPDHVIGRVVSAKVEIAITAGIASPSLINDLARAASSVGKQLPQSAIRALSTLATSQWTSFSALQPALDPAVAKYSTISQKLQVLTELFGGDLMSRSGEIGAWAEEVLRTVVRDASKLSETDGTALAEIAISLKDEVTLKNIIMPTFIRNQNNTRFAMAFLVQWKDNAGPVFSQATVAGTLTDAWNAAMTGFGLSLPTAEPVRNSPVYHFVRATQANSTNRDAGNIATNLACMVDFFLGEQNMLSGKEAQGSVQQLCTVLHRDAMAAEPAVFPHLILPFFRLIQPQMKDNGDSKVDSLLPSTCWNMCEQYVRRFVKKQPSMVESWQRNRVSCTCGDCYSLNIFLISATQQVGRFAVNKQRRQHLHRQLESAVPDCKHETERRGSPQTLVVTKRNRSKAVYEGWLARCRPAYEELMKFDHELLRRVLGDRYDRIVHMQIVTTDPARGPAFPGRPPLQVVANPSAARAGVKRKADDVEITGAAAAKRKPVVIDLCSDSD